jgi:hypothetical protein
MRIPIHHTVSAAGDAARLLSPQELGRLAARLSELDGQPQADIIRLALTRDEERRSAGEARLWTAVCRRPSWKESLAIKGQAVGELRAYCQEHGLEASDDLLGAFVAAARLETLCERVEDAEGSRQGGWQAIPEALREEVAEALSLLLSLPKEAEDYLLSGPGSRETAPEPGPEATTPAETCS